MLQLKSPRFSRFALAASIAAVLAGCGGGGGDGGSGALPQTGTLTDSPVSGINYETSGGLSGVTDAQGHFDYYPGDTVTFTLGALSLASVPASGTITPIELATTGGVVDVDKLQNLLVLFQSLDSDANPDNGLGIPALVSTLLTDTLAGTITLTQDPALFASLGNATLSALITAAGGSAALVSPGDALTNFRQSFLSQVEGTWIFSSNGRTVLTRWDADGHYAEAEFGTAADGGTTGMENGTFTWDPLSGALTASAIGVDTNGTWGFSDPLADETFLLSFDGETLIGTDRVTGSEDVEYRFSRVAASTTGIEGTWGMETGTDFGTQQFVFMADGTYYLIDPVGDDNCGSQGVEQGRYTITSNVISFSNTVHDTNGCAGLSDIGDTASFPMTLDNATGTMTWDENGNILTLYRAGVAPAI